MAWLNVQGYGTANYSDLTMTHCMYMYHIKLSVCTVLANMVRGVLLVYVSLTHKLELPERGNLS